MSNHKLAAANLEGAVMFGQRPQRTRYESPIAAGGISANIGAMHAGADFYHHGNRHLPASDYWVQRANEERNRAFMLSEQFSPNSYGAWIAASWAAVWAREPALLADLLLAFFLCHAWVAQDGRTLPRYSDRMRGPALPVCGARGYPERVSNPLITRMYCIATRQDPWTWRDSQECIRLANADWMWPARVLKQTGYRLPTLIATACRAVSGAHQPARKLFEFLPPIRTRVPHVFFRGEGVTGSYMDGNPNGNTPPTLAAYCIGQEIGALQPHGRARRVGKRDPATAGISAQHVLMARDDRTNNTEQQQLPKVDLEVLTLRPDADPTLTILEAPK